MPARPPASPPDETAALSADDFARRLRVRYLLVFLTVAGLIVADQAVIQPLLVRMNVFAPIVNLAGRQRMLSQRLAKAALALQATSDAGKRTARRSEIHQALEQWTAAHDALRLGSIELAIPKIHSPAIAAAWNELQPHVDAMNSAAERLLAADADADADAVEKLSQRAAIETILKHEAPFLSAMHRIVTLLEEQAAVELYRLRTLALSIAGAIVALLVGLGAFVVRPAALAVHNQVELLESRVAARTRVLNATLESLRKEISEREQAESRSRALSAQLAHADRVQSLGRLAAGLAHELNQPLGAIANYAAACDATLTAEQDEQSRNRIHHYLCQMQQASLRAGAIVRRMRNFIRPGDSRLANVDLIALVGEVVDLCRPEVARAEVEFALDLPTDRTVTVAADPIQIQQVLVNLVQNALHAMAAAPPQRRRLDVRMSVANDAVQVDVTDKGAGLKDADPDVLFAPFHTSKADGLGIGLSICRSIMEQHRGTIWAKSNPSGGAQFSFVLPLAAQHVLQPAC